MPHRPTNLPAPPFEQYEIPVTVPGTPSARRSTLQTRFLIASAQSEPAPVPRATSARRQLPPIRPEHPRRPPRAAVPPRSRSGAEEALDLIPHLLEQGRPPGSKYAVISFDLPNNGYSETFGHSGSRRRATTFPSLPTDNEPHPHPGPRLHRGLRRRLRRRENDAIDARHPADQGSDRGRLRRQPRGEPWVAARAAQRDAGLARPRDRRVEPGIRVGADGQRPLEEHRCPDSASRTGRRRSSRIPARDYFPRSTRRRSFQVIVPFTQPQLWYSSGWEPCKSFNIDGSRRARREVYSTNLRQWHWRVAGEQLIYSHVDRVVHRDNNTPWRYELNVVRQLLIASAEDNFAGSNIFDATRKLAGLMRTTPGTSLFLLNTGHSVHFSARRIWLSRSPSSSCRDGQRRRADGSTRADRQPRLRPCARGEPGGWTSSLGVRTTRSGTGGTRTVGHRGSRWERC